MFGGGGFIATLQNMGVIKKLGIDHYWSKLVSQFIPCFSQMIAITDLRRYAVFYTVYNNTLAPYNLNMILEENFNHYSTMHFKLKSINR